MNFTNWVVAQKSKKDTKKTEKLMAFRLERGEDKKVADFSIVFYSVLPIFMGDVEKGMRFNGGFKEVQIMSSIHGPIGFMVDRASLSLFGHLL